jgi:hypothetical protein
MSQKNVEIVRAVLEAWNAGDMDAFVSCTTPTSSGEGRRGGRSQGLSWVGKRSCASSNSLAKPLTPSAWNRPATSSTLGTGSSCGWPITAKATAPEMNLEMTQVVTVRNGRILYREYFWDHAEALEALELSEKDTHADSS